MTHLGFGVSRSNARAVKLLAGSSIVALALGASEPALAQAGAASAASATAEASTSKPAAGSNAIVVTGIRASLRSARDRKKNTEEVVDSITAQDIGALPDRSVSEALQRIPGVTLERTNAANDPARLSAEGGAIFIRGLSWVRSEFNGRDTFSANNGRSLGFEDVPADLLAGVDVYKNPTAEHVEGAIGGLVNLRTRKPFDQSGHLIGFSADVNHADLRKKNFLSGSVLGTDRWHTGIGDIGILLAASLNNIGNRTDEMQTDRYTATQGVAATSFAGKTYWLPNNFGIRRIDWTQRRIAFDGSLQWRPASNFLLTLEGIYSQAKSHDFETVIGAGTPPAPGTPGTSYTFDTANNVLTGHVPAGVYSGINLDDNRYGRNDDITKDFSANIVWDVTPRLKITADVQRVVSSMRMLSMTAFVNPQTSVDLDFDLRGANPWIHYSSPALTTQSDYYWSAAMDHYDKNDANEWAYRADAEYSLDGNPFLKSFRFGARATDREAISRASTWNWSILSHQPWGGGPPVYLNQTGGAGLPQNPGLPSQSTLFNFNNFFRGAVPYPGQFWAPSANLVSNGTSYAYSFLKSTLTNGWGWSPIPADTYAVLNDQHEKTLAGYGLLRFGMDESPLGKFDGNIGVRVVGTRNDAGPLQLTQPTQLNIPSVAACQAAATSKGISTSICDPLAQLYAFVGTGTAFPKLGQIYATKSNYTDVLPSLNLRFFLQNNMFVRFAAAKAIVRPSFAQLLPNISLGINFDSLTGFPSGCTALPCTSPFTGTAANPTLKPIKSTQFDASWEYYFGNAGQLSAALFYKRLQDFIFAGNTVLPVTQNGTTINFQMTQTQNGSKGSVKGFELAYQQFYDFLPRPLDGFGLGGNLTYVKTSGTRNSSDSGTFIPDPNLPLEGMSPWAYNVFAMYEKYGVSARLAYNWRSHYLLTTSAANINQPVWSRAYGQLDGSIFYNLNRQFKVGMQATNLLASRTYLEVGYSNRHPLYSSNVTDRRVALVLRGQF